MLILVHSHNHTILVLSCPTLVSGSSIYPSPIVFYSIRNKGKFESVTSHLRVDENSLHTHVHVFAKHLSDCVFDLFIQDEKTMNM